MVKFGFNGLLTSLWLASRALSSPIATVNNLTSTTAPPGANVPQVYVCQNYDWEAPCRLIVFVPHDEGQQALWMTTAPTGKGPFDNSNYTVGSWGPSSGVFTYWEDVHGNATGLLTYPGTPRVDSYWSNNIYLFAAFFHIDT